MTNSENLIYYSQREGIALTKLEKLAKELNITDEHFLKALDEASHCFNNVVNNIELVGITEKRFNELIENAKEDSKSALQTDKEFLEAERSEDDEER